MAKLQLDVTLSPKVDASQLNAEMSTLKVAISNASKELASGEGAKIKIIDETAFKADVNSFKSDSDKIKNAVNETIKASGSASTGFKNFGSSLSSALSGVEGKMKGALSPILNVFGGNILTKGVEGLVGGFGDIIAKGKASLQVTNDMSIAFTQAGLRGAELQKAMKDTGSFAGKLASEFALPVPKIREFSLTAASLTGATGKANQDLTKLAIGIEKATGGMIDGTMAIRLFGKGVTDPESEMAMAKLAKQFPALGAALKGIKDPAEATKVALNYLNPTFQEMTKQAVGPLGSMQRFETAVGSIKTALGKVLIEGIAPFVTSFANNIIPVIQSVVKWIGSLTEYVKPLAPLFAGIGTAAAGIVGGLLALQGVKIFKGWVEDAFSFGKALKEDLLPMFGKLKDISLGDISEKIQTALNPAKLKDMVVSAGESAQSLIDNFKGIGSKISESIGSGLSSVKGVFNNMKTASLTAIKDFPDKALGYFKNFGSNVKSLTSKAFDFGGSLKSGLSSIKDFAMNMLSKLIPSFTATGIAGTASFGAVATAETAAGVAGVESAVATGTSWQAALWPITAVVAGIIGIGAAAYGLIKAFSNTGGSIKNVATAIWDGMKSIWNGIVIIFNAALSTIIKSYNFLFDIIVAPFKIVGNVISAVFNTISNVVSGAIGALFGLGEKSKSSGNIMTNAFNGVVWIIKQIGVAFDTAGKFINDTVSFISNILSKLIKDYLEPVASVIAGSIVIALKLMWAAIEALGSLIMSALTPALNWMWDILKSIGEFIANIFIKAWEGLKGAFDKVSGIVTSAGNSFNWIKAILIAITGPIGAVVAIGFKLVDVFKKAGDMGTFVNAVMQGLSQMFNVFKNALSNMWEGLKSFNIKQIVSSLSGLPSQMAEAFSKGTNEYINAANKQKEVDKAITEQNKQSANQQEESNKKKKESVSALIRAQDLLNKLQKGEVTALQAKAKDYLPAITKAYNVEATKMSEIDNKTYAETIKQINEIIKKETALNKENKEKNVNILEGYEALKKQLENEEQLTAQTIETKLAQEGRKKNIQDELEAAKRKEEILAKEREELMKTIELYDGVVEGAKIVSIKPTLKKEDQEKLRNALAALVLEESKQASINANLQFNEREQAEKIESALIKAQDQLDRKALEYKVEMGIEPKISLTGYDLAEIKSQYDELQKAIAESKKKYDEASSKEEKDKAQTEYLEKQSLSFDLQKKLQETEKKYDEELFKQRLAGVSKYSEQEKLTQIRELENTYAERLKTVRGNVAAEIAVNEELANKRDEIEEKYRLQSQTGWEIVKSNISNAISASLLTIDIVDTGEARKAAKSELDRIKNEQNELKKSYRSGETAYADYVTKMNELDKQRTEQSKIANQSQINWAETSMKALNKIFNDIAESSVKTNLKLADNMIASYRRIGIINKMQEGVQDKTSAKYVKLEEEKTEASTNATAAIGEAYMNMGLAIGGTLVSTLADHKSFTKALVMATLAGLKAIIPVYIATIYAKEISALSFGGIATAAGLTAIITGLLSVAESAVGKLEFAKGGLVPGGEKLIKINELGQEFVLNHISTKQSLSALNEINTRKISIDQYAAEKYKNVNTNSNIDLTRLEHKFDILNETIRGTARRSNQTVNLKQELVINDSELIRRVEKKRTAFVRSW